ncbi:aspartyl-phosphate phosphatase Spo0E family protein [Paenibacillus sp. TRM 82003]|nr:aspartyl-phosphate phosphatase Spo0E family protein [Paenibacillus sp. TRM 82003]
MRTNERLRLLQERLQEAVDRCGSLTHPIVVSASQLLDEAILDYYRGKGSV